MSIVSVALIILLFVFGISALLISIVYVSNQTVETGTKKQLTESKVSLWKWFGLFVYIPVSLHLVYSLISSSVSTGNLIFSPFILFEILVCIVGSIIIWKKYKESKLKNTGKNVQNLTVWVDWKTWVMIGLGYVLWGIGQTLCIAKGGPFHPEIAPLPDGMFYIPYSGILYALLLTSFVLLAMRSQNAWIFLFGILFGLTSTLVGLLKFWFVPYSVAHLVYIPVLRYIGIPGILFPADPVVSWMWVAIGIIFLYSSACLVYKERNEMTKIIGTLGNVVLIVSAVIFLPQLFL